MKPATAAPPAPLEERERWLARLNSLRESVGTGKPVTSTEAILDDFRRDR